MEKREKIKNILIGVLVVVILILSGVCVYFAFIKNDEQPSDNNGGNKQEEKVDDNNVIDDNKEYKSENLDELIQKYKNNSDVKNVEYEIIENVKPTELESSNRGTIYKVSEDGILTITFTDGKSVTVSNVSNIKGIKKVGLGEDIYIITENRDLYSYNDFDVDGNLTYTNKAVKITTVNSIEKFVHISIYYNNNYGGDDIEGVIDKNNNFIELFSVAN